MEETATKKKVHEGRNAQYFREARGLGQKNVAEVLGCTQAYIAKLEGMEILPEKNRLQLADLYKIDVALLTNMQIDPDKISLTIQNNTFEEGSKNIVGNNENIDHDNVYNPVEEILKLTKEKEELYQQLIQKEQERANRFCQLFEDLTKQIAQINKK